MKILIIHNSYQVRGGEDEVVASEVKMLKDRGHEVAEYRRKNFSKDMVVRLLKSSLVGKSVDSLAVYHEVKEAIRQQRPDIVHIHNTFYVMTRAVYRACKDEGVPVVQSLHNYRFLCPIAIFWRPSVGVCEECLHQGFQAAVKNKCWKNSRWLSRFLVDAVASYREDDFIKRHVDKFIALNEVSQNKYQENGFKDCRFVVKPQFLDFDPGVSAEKDDYGLFVGGFFAYKGVETLLQAWQKMDKSRRLKLIGDGPLLEALRTKYTSANIEFLGRKPLNETLECMKRSLFVVVPSECYETGPRVIIEAFACGVPVVGSEIADGGAIGAVVEEGATGVLFKSRNVQDLAHKLRFMFDNKTKVLEMGRRARKEFESKYTVEKNYLQLIGIYEDVIAEHKHRRSNAGA